MSKQLALAISASVLAMSAFALFAPAGGDSVERSAPRWSVQAEAASLPSLARLLPGLQ
jgi:hypothetical protein